MKREGAGLFGLIVSRKGTGEAAEHILRDIWLYEHKMIVVLGDNDVKQMLIDKKNGNVPAELILKKIENFRLKV